MTQAPRDTLELLDAFAAAFNRHELGALMRLMTEDCVFEASAGPDVDGQRHEGRTAVAAAFSEIFATYPDARWNDPRHFWSGDRALTEWLFTGTRSDGTRVEVQGCDVFTLRDGKIAVKNSFRKQRAAPRG